MLDDEGDGGDEEDCTFVRLAKSKHSQSEHRRINEFQVADEPKKIDLTGK